MYTAHTCGIRRIQQNWSLPSKQYCACVQSAYAALHILDNVNAGAFLLHTYMVFVDFRFSPKMSGLSRVYITNYIYVTERDRKRYAHNIVESNDRKPTDSKSVAPTAEDAKAGAGLYVSLVYNILGVLCKLNM